MRDRTATLQLTDHKSRASAASLASRRRLWYRKPSHEWLNHGKPLAGAQIGGRGVTRSALDLSSLSVLHMFECTCRSLKWHSDQSLCSQVPDEKADSDRGRKKKNKSGRGLTCQRERSLVRVRSGNSPTGTIKPDMPEHRFIDAALASFASVVCQLLAQVLKHSENSGITRTPRSPPT